MAHLLRTLDSDLGDLSFICRMKNTDSRKLSFDPHVCYGT